MELCDLDYKILKIVKRKGPMDLTAIKSKFPKTTVSDLRLLELSRPPIIYPGHPNALEDHRLLIREQENGIDVYSIAPLGRQALRERREKKREWIASHLWLPVLLVILEWLIVYLLQRFLP